MFEIEKKYRLNVEQREHVLAKLQAVGARFAGEDFEENTLYNGGALSLKASVLRLRKTEGKAILTYKERLPSESAIKRQIEHETEVADAEAVNLILQSLGFASGLVYEKRRQTWHLENAEIVLDELPFGLFMEIEAPEQAILQAEKTLGIENFAAENQTYPALTAQHGKQNGDLIEARFEQK